MKNKITTYISVGILSIIMIYGVYVMNVKNRLINENGRFTIGVIQKTKVGSKGIRVFINYYYKDKKEVVDYMEEYIERKKLSIGKRIFIKFIPGNNIEYVKLHIDCIVPDSIKNAPSNGWSEQWMKDNFPDYMKLINK